MPHHELGMRIDPPWSPPIAISTSPAARSAALPLEEPPAENPGLRGFCVGPVSELASVPDLERHGWRRRVPLDEVLHHERYTPRP